MTVQTTERHTHIHTVKQIAKYRDLLFGKHTHTHTHNYSVLCLRRTVITHHVDCALGRCLLGEERERKKKEEIDLIIEPR